VAVLDESVTLAIPLYNGARHIRETLDSVQSQLTRPQEVLVIDDGSSDGGPDIVRAHPIGARLIEQSHLGVAVARNHGLAEARSRWITFLDQDDLWHPRRLQRLMEWLRTAPDERIVVTGEVTFSTIEEVDRLSAMDPLVGSWAARLVPERTAYETLCAEVELESEGVVERFDHVAMLRGPITVTTSFVAETQLLRLAGGFAPHALAMDDYWLLVNAARLHPIVKVPQPTVFYRVHVGATSRSTRLALPFLSSAVALRLGRGLVSVDEGLDTGSTGPLHEHLLDELLRSNEYRDPRVRRAAKHLAGLLWQGGRTGDLRKALLRHRAPWAVRATRTLRAKMAGGQGQPRHPNAHASLSNSKEQS